MFENKKVFVAGGRTGFVGTNIAKALLDKGAFVHVHSLKEYKSSNFAPNTPNISESTGKLTVPANLPGGIDYVFNCAAHTSGAHEMVTQPVRQIHVNTILNTVLLDAASELGVKKFVFISSSAVYPDVDMPLSEDKGFLGDPPDVYFGPAWMKRYSEKLAEFYFKQYGMEILIIRPSNIYGPYSDFNPETAHVLPALIRKFTERQDPIEIWGTPEVWRDFIYVDDFVKGVLSAFEQSRGFDVYNIASGQLYTIGEAVEYIRELTGYSGKFYYNPKKPMTVRKRQIDISKAKTNLQFTAGVSLKEGLKKTIEWYLSRIIKGQND